MTVSMIEGRLVRGLGQATDFTQMDWVREQLVALAGIDPHPGTLNLVLADADNRRHWRHWRTLPGRTMDAGEAAFCNARCYPVTLQGRVPAAVILPEVADYPEDKVEVVAALPLRRHLALEEGSRVRMDLCRPLAARAVLFDIDGTMVDSVGAYLEVARDAAKAHGVEVTEQHVRHCLATGSNFWRGVVPDDRHDAEVVRQSLSAHAARAWPRVLREHGRVFADLVPTLDAMKAAGMVLGIVSGARPEVLELLRDEGVLDRFDAILLGDDVARRKPHPEGIETCLGKLGIRREEAVYVGDAPVDIQASRAAGVGAVAVLTGAADSATLSAHGSDRLVARLAGLMDVIEPA